MTTGTGVNDGQGSTLCPDGAGVAPDESKDGATAMASPAPAPAQPATAQCTHWHLHPLMYPIRCTRPAGHDGWHLVGSESWNDATGEYAS